MAIIVEEMKNKVDFVRLLEWTVIIAIFGAATYYLFFAAPELVVISPPEDFQNIAPISQVVIHPEEVLNSPAFQALQAPSFPLPTSTGPAAVGRGNPFIAP